VNVCRKICPSRLQPNSLSSLILSYRRSSASKMPDFPRPIALHLLERNAGARKRKNFERIMHFLRQASAKR
jgi:hypothetical protein